MFVKRFRRGVLFAALRIGHPFFCIIIMAMIELFPDLPIISRKQKETIANLKAGEIDNLRVSNQLPIDDIVKFGLKEGFLKEGLKSFPDPRKSFDIPIEVLLLP